MLTKDNPVTHDLDHRSWTEKYKLMDQVIQATEMMTRAINELLLMLGSSWSEIVYSPYPDFTESTMISANRNKRAIVSSMESSRT